MSARPQPPRPMSVIHSDRSMVFFPNDDRAMLGAEIAFSEEDIERFRTGRVCLVCHEPQSTPFPEVCELTLPNGQPGCGYRIRDNQLRDFAREFTNETIKHGSRIDYEAEIEHLNEIATWEAQHQEELPDSIKNRDPGTV